MGLDLFEDADEALTLFWKHRRHLDDLSEDVCALRASLEFAVLGGRTGIRTLERVAPLTVFKTVAFVRSATLPAMKGTERAPSGAADRCRKAVAPVSRGDECKVSSLLDLGRLTRRHETVHAALPAGHLTR